MAYTTINKSTDYFNTKLWTGTGSSTALTGVGFKPDWTWIKNRAINSNHALFDSVRGVQKVLNSNNTNVEATGTSWLNSFDTDGFTINGGDGFVNGSGNAMASWNWKAGTTSIPSGSSIAPTAVSINATAGFGIYEYTGTGGAGRTIAHGLNSAPKMIIVKRLTGTRDWSVYHSSLGATKYLELNNTQAVLTDTGMWNDTEPTSSLITFGNDGQTNGGGDPIIMYAFADVQGYSKFGSYVATGTADSAFCYTGFSPAFVMIKRTDGADSWVMIDSKRDTFNQTNKTLHADLSDAEVSRQSLDFLSNGFKIKAGNGLLNGTGNNHIYMAFAEAPLVGTNNVPCTAR